MTWVTGLAARSSLTSCQQFLMQRNGSEQILCWQGNTVECLHCGCRHADHIATSSRSSSWMRMIRVMWWSSRVHCILVICRKLWLSFSWWNGVQHVGLRLLSDAICTKHTHSSLSCHYTSHHHSRTASSINDLPVRLLSLTSSILDRMYNSHILLFNNYPNKTMFKSYFELPVESKSTTLKFYLLNSCFNVWTVYVCVLSL